MKTTLFVCCLFAVTIISINFNGWCYAYPQQQEEAAADEENYTAYALLYPEIAKKIGEEPIEIIDIIKSVRVYDSDDDKTSTAEELTEPPPPDRLEVELVNGTAGTAGNSTNLTQPPANPTLW